jgi:hypothetical protein
MDLAKQKCRLRCWYIAKRMDLWLICHPLRGHDKIIHDYNIAILHLRTERDNLTAEVTKLKNVIGKFVGHCRHRWHSEYCSTCPEYSLCQALEEA